MRFGGKSVDTSNRENNEYPPEGKPDEHSAFANSGVALGLNSEQSPHWPLLPITHDDGRRSVAPEPRGQSPSPGAKSVKPVEIDFVAPNWAVAGFCVTENSEN